MSKMSKPHLLLASQSPRRRELLALLGIPFEVTASNVTEVPRADESPVALAIRLSQAKARAACSEASPQPSLRRLRIASAAEQFPMDKDASGFKSTHKPSQGFDAIIIACDTVVALDGEMLGKPRNAAEATAMLRRLRGRRHTVHSAVTMLETTTGHTLTDVAETQVVMRAYTDAEMAAYVASGDPLDKAGAYAIQHSGFRPVAELRGCYANVMGLPLCHLIRCLRVWEVEPLQDVPTVCQAHTCHHCSVHARM